LLVTAAFIGPGTVLTASKAGATYGYTLLWAVVFAVGAAIVLQEMSARLGIVTGSGLSQAISDSFQTAWIRRSMLGLVLVAILFGNAAYQTGNIIGAATGLELLTGFGPKLWIYVIGAIALAIVWIGRFDVLQYFLTTLVVIMSILFVIAAVRCGPDIGKLFSGLVPRVTAGSGWLVIGLIGTTVVPYNLFLHANAAATRWGASEHAGEPRDLAWVLRYSMWDTIMAVLIGGVITAAILVTAAVAYAGDAEKLGTARDVAEQLRPALGQWAERLFAIGLFAAGLTSAITAPVAAGYAAAGCFGWPAQLSSARLKLVASAVILAGIVCGILFGSSPSQAIITAQVANGILLPILAGFLLIAVNRDKLMGQFKNRSWTNLLGGLVLLITLLIAAGQFNSVWSKLQALFAGG
jgi:NRAMP (natural resistance-associated macrophage protein)-like metal ion transporter